VATSNPEAYSLYLQATAIFNRRDGARFPDAIAQIEQALRLDPTYARGWSRLATLRVLTPIYRPGEFDSSLPAAEKAARRAIELDSSLGEPHAVLGLTFVQRRKLLDAEPAFRRALELDPEDVTANFWFATNLVSEGYFQLANRILDKVLTIDPMYPNGLNWRALTAFGAGDVDLAERLARRSRDAGLAHAGLALSFVADARGQHEEAIAQLTSALSALSLDLPQGFAEATARGALGDVQARDRALALIKSYLATRPAVISGPVPYALMRLGRPAEALELLARGPSGNDSLAFPTLWLPAGRPTRTLPEFSEAARRIGLMEVWEREGPPDLCQRVAPGKYVCR
jgi:tetratricopeptide (TPR) repeat protein